MARPALKRLGILSLVLLAAAPGAAYGAGEHRQLGPHVHGHGTLGIAIEGKSVQMELRAPGMDIVGFEHPPSTDQDKAQLASAKTIFEQKPLSLFKLPADAGCTVTSSSAETIPEAEDDDDHDASEPSGQHNDFHAAIMLTCSSADQLTTIDFPFFDRFPGSNDLDVTIIDDKGQNAYEVSRSSPRLVRSQ